MSRRLLPSVASRDDLVQRSSPVFSPRCTQTMVATFRIATRAPPTYRRAGPRVVQDGVARQATFKASRSRRRYRARRPRHPASNASAVSARPSLPTHQRLLSAPGTSMPLREFTDKTGATWRVWETRPTGTRLAVRPEFVDGWLTFELGTGTADGTRRRLAPIPTDWAERSHLELRRLCLDAHPERPRTRLPE
jgi:hypothetical protein